MSPLELYQNSLGGLRQQAEISLKGYQDRTAELDRRADAYGQNQLIDANNYWKQQAANTQQSAFGNGMANATITQGLLSGVSDQRARNIRQINNDINDKKLGIYQQASGDSLGAYDRYAQLGQQMQLSYAQLAQQQQQQAAQLALGYAQIPSRGMGNYAGLPYGVVGPQQGVAAGMTRSMWG